LTLFRDVTALSSANRPPPTATVDVVDELHGRRVADPYRWLEELDASAVRQWVAAQNAATQAWLGAAPRLRDALRARLTRLTDHQRRSVPSRRGRWWFWLANDGLNDQDMLMVDHDPDGAGRALIDPNRLSDDATVSLAATSASHDGQRVAYALSEAGSDWMTWHVVDVPTGRNHPDRVEWAKFATAAWARDGSGFYYGRFDAPEDGQAHEAAHRGHQVWFHRLGAGQGDDRLILARPEDPELVFSPEVTDDGRWLVITGSRGTERRSGVWLADLAAADPAAAAPTAWLDELDARYEVVAAEGATLLVLTDAGAPRQRVVAVDVADAGRDAWREVIGEDPTDTLEHVARVGDHLVCAWLHHARSRVTAHSVAGRRVAEVELGELGSVEAISGRRGDTVAHLGFAGFTRPPSVLRCEPDRGATWQVWSPDVPVDPAAFTTQQVWVTSSDGERVPAFVVSRADLTLADGDHPTLLWGYGGFAIPVTPMFRTWWLAWVERGGVLVVPNLRGGGEYGAAWHEAGRRAHKQQVFDDAVAVAEWLVGQGWTRPTRLAVSGGSNGGLLAGACLTQRPDLFGAAVPEVGVLDMLRFHRFTIGWAWASDYGTADDPQQLEWLLGYSPLHRIVANTAYPPTLVTTGDTDDRVVPAHSYKFAAALQAAQAGGGQPAPVLLRVTTRAGHGAGKPVGVLLEERADVLTFLCRTVGAGCLDRV